MNEAAAQSHANPAGGAAGAMLLAERRRQGLSLGDISRQLKLSVRQVEALERDDYSGYKSAVFIHGFIRNYAKLLGLDPGPLIRATDSMLNPPPAAVAAPTEPERTPPAPVAAPRKFPMLPAIAVVVVLAVVVIAIAGRRTKEPSSGASVATARDKAETRAVAEPKAKPDTDTQAKAVVREAPAESKPVDAKPESRPAAPKAAESKLAESRPADTRPAEPRPVPKTEPGGAIAAETGPRLTVRMVFEQDSWVEIKDRSGTTIFGQLNASGSVRRVSGEPPLSIVVGNAAGVRLYQGDKSVDLGPHTRVDVARLTLE